MNAKFLPNRKAVLDATTQLTAAVTRQWIGMGRTAAWIKLPPFRQALDLARSRGAAFKVVIFFEGDAHKHVPTWGELGAEVRFFEHGYIRLLIFDDADAIIAFPKVVTSLLEDREYFGYHVHDPLAVADLLNYFNQIWEEATILSPSLPSSDRSQVREKFASGILRFIIRVIRRALPEILE